MCWMSVFDGSWVAKYVIFVDMDFGDWLERETKGRLAKKKLMGGSCLDLIMNSSSDLWVGGCVPVVGAGLTISLGQALGFLCFIFIASFYTIFFFSLRVGILSPFSLYTCLSF